MKTNLRKEALIPNIIRHTFGVAIRIAVLVLLLVGTAQAQIIIPYLDTGYKYKVVSFDEGAGFEQPSFDDSGFSVGDAGFGSSAGCSPGMDAKTFWPGSSDILLRKEFNLPSGLTNMKISVAVDNDIQIFINGYDISGGLIVHEGCAVQDNVVFSVPDSVWQTGNNIIAIRARDRGAPSYIDIQVTTDIVIITPLIAAQYHFDGDAKDSSGNGNDGVINGGAMFTAGVRGQALSFDGVDDYVRVNNIPIGQSMTALAWAKSATSTWNNYGWIASARSANGFIIHPDTNSRSWGGYIVDSSASYQQIGSHTPDDITKWHQYGVMYDNSAQKGYMIFDGQIIATKTLTLTRTSGTSVDFGRDQGDRYGNGLIDEVQIYGRALSADELKAQYDDIVDAPNQPTELAQLKSDGSTVISIGGTTSEKTVVFKGKVVDSDGHQVKLELELRNSNEYDNEFDETKPGLKESELVASGSEATIIVTDLINGNYHWRARTVDEYGNKSEWYDYGGNAVSEADFMVSQGFRFVQLSDVHIGPDIEECFPGTTNNDDWSEKCGDLWLDSLESFIEVLEKVKKDDPEFVLVTGDSVEWNNPSFYQGFNTQISKLNKDIYVVPGNHDRRGIKNPKNKLEAAWHCEDSSCMDNYMVFVGGKDPNGVHGDYITGENYYFDKSGYRFIGLDSGNDPLVDIVHDFSLLDNPTGSGLSPAQRNYVINNAIDGKTIVFMHHPTNDTDNNYNTISQNRELFIATELDKNITLTLTGHTHNFKSFLNKRDSGPSLRKNLLIQTRSATKSDSEINIIPGYSIIDVGWNIAGEIRVHDIKILGNEFVPGKIVTVRSPADLHLYDEFGRHTGLNASGGIDDQIPNSYYIQGAKIGNITLPESVILYNNTLNYRTEIISNFSKENITTEQSHFNLTIEERTGGSIKTTTYDNVVIEADSRAYVEASDSQSIQVDLNNDGTNETVKAPDTITTDYTPQAAIASPATGSEWDQGQSISFSGTGTDSEDGTLSSLIWISDRDDVIGQGNFAISNLSAGTHRITLRVNDSIGQVNTTSIVLTIDDTVPPNLAIDYPAENKIFKNPDIVVRGIAYDDSGIANVTVNGIQAGQDNWNANISLSEGENTIEVIATDNAGFNNTASRIVYYNSSLASDIEPPGAVTNLAHTTGYDNVTGAYVNWTWDNPQDPDFSYAIVYLDNIPMGSTSRSYMNFTGLSSDADYNISIKTADIVDNVNQAAVSNTVRTPLETPLPEIRYINGTVIDSITKTGIAGATISINASVSTVSDSLGFYSLAVSEGEYNLTAKLDPTYYMNNTVQVSTIGKAVASQDIELLKKPIGSITGNVRN